MTMMISKARGRTGVVNKNKGINRPLKIRIKRKESLRTFLGRLIADVQKRERNVTGVRLLGPTMQHLVGAKLSIALGKAAVTHHPSTQADAQYDRTGDFELADVVIHVTSAPSEKLIAKCASNIEAGLRPVVVTLSTKTAVVEGLAQNVGLEGRIEAIDFESFIVHNVLEWSLKSRRPVRASVNELVATYNEIVARHEAAHGLRLALNTHGGDRTP